MTEERTSIPTADPSLSSDGEYAELRAQLEHAVRRICPPWLAGHREDLVQVALLRIVEIARKSEQTRQFSSSYLWRTAYSSLVDEIRRQRRRREVRLDEEAEGEVFDSGNPGPRRILESRELDRAMRQCLGRMAESRRLALTLHLQGFRQAEAAPILGWNAKRVYNLVHRGLKDLRECLAEKGMQP